MSYPIRHKWFLNRTIYNRVIMSSRLVITNTRHQISKNSLFKIALTINTFKLKTWWANWVKSLTKSNKSNNNYFCNSLQLYTHQTRENSTKFMTRTYLTTRQISLLTNHLMLSLLALKLGNSDLINSHHNKWIMKVMVNVVRMKKVIILERSLYKILF